MSGCVGCFWYLCQVEVGRLVEPSGQIKTIRGVTLVGELSGAAVTCSQGMARQRELLMANSLESGALWGLSSMLQEHFRSIRGTPRPLNRWREFKRMAKDFWQAPAFVRIVTPSRHAACPVSISQQHEACPADCKEILDTTDTSRTLFCQSSA